ncbi:hypothetical protein [Hymenobacter terricola]|uniref:hypothetical protein n=1 Tax=Hymenobacter terricola TaxID=2819236 RepID=UPI001B30C2E6|nr:hypothetical protein [Hymenobacter terricola]
MPNTINLGLERIQDVRFAYHEPQKDLAESGIDLNFSITNRFDIWPSEHMVIITVEVSMDLEIEGEQPATNSRLLNYETVFFFKVAGVDFTSQFDADTGEEFITLPTPIAAALAGAAYSTCRGILFARTAGTQVSRYLMPMANTLKLIEGMGDKFRRARLEEQSGTVPTFLMTRQEVANGESSEKPADSKPRRKARK